MGALATRTVLLTPRDPASKGAWNGGQARSETYSCPAATSPGYNDQFGWLGTANTKVVRTSTGAPDRWARDLSTRETDKPQMLAQPPVPPVTGW